MNVYVNTVIVQGAASTRHECHSLVPCGVCCILVIVLRACSVSTCL
jgi:hypothetical protein